MKVRIQLFTIFSCLILISMMTADLFSSLGIPFVNNTDEILGMLAWIGVILYFLCHPKITRKKLQIIGMLIFLLLLGFWSNMTSSISLNIKLILTDGFLFSKPYIIFLFMTLFLTETLASSIVNFMQIISKLMLWLMVLFVALGEIITLPTSLNGTFIFFSNYSGTVSWWTILFLSVIWAAEKNNQKVFCYMLLSAVIIFSNHSGLGMISFGLGVLIYIFLGKKKKIKWPYLVVGCMLCLVIGKNEIAEYIFADTAPRAILLKYAFVTANTYLPFGGGFATYGSNSAIRDYSLLYYKYGFDQVYGMSEDYHPYLMDNYYQQVLGQLGYIGFIVLLWFMYKIIKKILRIEALNIRNASLLLYSCLIFAGIGFGTASSWGCTIYMLIPAFCLMKRKPKNGA